MLRGTTSNSDVTTVLRSCLNCEIRELLLKKSSNGIKGSLCVEDNKLILLARLGELRDAGMLSDEDFAYEKKRVLSHEPPPEKPAAIDWLKQLWKEAPDWVPDPLVKFWPWPLNIAVLLLLVALLVIPS